MIDLNNKNDVAELVKYLINEHTELKSSQQRSIDYYQGKHNILNRVIEGQFDESGNEIKPNEKIVVNYAELIVETSTNYLFSKKQSYSINVGDDDPNYLMADEFLEEVKKIYHDNDEEVLTYSLGRTSSVAGFGVEYHFVKDEKPKFVELQPTQWIFVELDGGKKQLAIRYYKEMEFVRDEENGLVKKFVTKVEVIDENRVEYYDETRDEDDNIVFSFTKSQPHFHGEIPVIRYKSKGMVGSEGVSDLSDDVLTLVDSFNMALSSTLNTIIMNSDPFLKVKNMNIDPEDYKKLKDARTLFFNENGDADYLTYDGQDTMRENFLNRIERLLFIISKTPDLFTKEGVQAGDSGIAIKMKFAGLQIKSQGKEKEFRKGLQKRLRLLARILEHYTGRPYYTNGIHRMIDIHFNYSVPQNTKELVEMSKNLLGQVSEKTRLALLPFVEDVEKELERMDEEKETAVDPYGDTLE